MPAGLNFLLLGAARSGTSAITEALNCFRTVFCAMEVIDAGECHKSIAFPHSFERRLASRPSGYHRDSLTALLARKRDGAHVIGSKHPSYDRTLLKLSRKTPGLKLVFIYRSPREFLNSWNRRALDPDDIGWHPGQRGAFGVLSVLSYLHALQRIGGDCLMIPYKAFSADVAGVSAGIVRTLGGDGDQEMADRVKLAQLQSAADALRDRRRAVLQNEKDLLAALDIERLDAVFGRETAFPFSEVASDVRRYRQSLLGRWGEAFVEGVIGYDDPQAVKYLIKMLHQPAIRAMFAEEAARSDALRRTLRALPRALKLRRLLLRQCELAACERFLRKMQGVSAASVSSINARVSGGRSIYLPPRDVSSA